MAHRRRAARSDADRPDQAPRRQAAGDLHRRGAARQPARPAARPRARASPPSTRTGPVVEATRRPALARMVAARRRRPRRHGRRQGVQPRRLDHRRRICAGSARAVPDTAFAQFHCCRWGVGEGSWLPAGAWQACVGDPAFTDGEDVWIGVDVGGERSATAVVWVNAACTSAAAIYHGDGGVLESRRPRPRARPPSTTSASWSTTRGGSGRPPQELEREGLVVVAFPQHDARMIPAQRPPARRDRRAAHHPARRSRARAARRGRDRPPLPPRLAHRQAEPAREHRRRDRAGDGRRARRAEARARRAPRMALKPCLGCGALVNRGSWCRICEPPRLRGRKLQAMGSAYVIGRPCAICGRPPNSSTT